MGFRDLWRAMFGRDHGRERPMTCGEMAERLFEYLDEELDEQTAQRVRDHLDVCAHCATRADFEQAFLLAVESASAAGEPLPEGLQDRVLAVLDEAETGEIPE